MFFRLFHLCISALRVSFTLHGQPRGAWQKSVCTEETRFFPSPCVSLQVRTLRLGCCVSLRRSEASTPMCAPGVLVAVCPCDARRRRPLCGLLASWLLFASATPGGVDPYVRTKPLVHGLLSTAFCSRRRLRIFCPRPFVHGDGYSQIRKVDACCKKKRVKFA